MAEGIAPLVVAGVIMTALTAYVLLAGADFGGGVWDLLAFGESRQRQRDLIAHAMGPVWEANHVWLILVIVLLFTCFPPVFARLAIVLHIPLTLMLIGIVLRGSAFTFRSYETRADRAQRRWGRLFSIASLVTPVLLGMIVGAIASGRAGSVAAEAGFTDTYLAPWLTPFSLTVGLMALGLFAFLAAIYLAWEAEDAALRETFRVRGLAAGVLVFLASMLALGIALGESGSPMGPGLTRATHSIPLQAATGLAAVTALVGLWTRRYGLARVAAGAQVTLILWGWGLAQYPYLVPPDLTIEGAAAPAVTLRLVLIALAVGALVLAPSLWYLFRVFKSRVARPPE